jgi:hypothetical protein
MLQLPLPDEWRITVMVCPCGRPVLKAFVFEKNGEKFFACPCSNVERRLSEAVNEKLSGGG